MRSEAQAAARLHHPGIITVHDIVTDAGRPWIVMELIHGRPLAEVIQQAGLLPVGRAADIGIHVLDALRAAHRQGVLHRDIKPANILLDDTGRVVLTDFGIAAIDDATALTATGQMVGSPAFMIAQRSPGRRVDGREALPHHPHQGWRSERDDPHETHDFAPRGRSEIGDQIVDPLPGHRDRVDAAQQPLPAERPLSGG